MCNWGESGTMGALCSKSSKHSNTVSAKANAYHDDRYQSNAHKSGNWTTTPQKTLEVRQPKQEVQESIAYRETDTAAAGAGPYGTTSSEDFYDGIPRYNPGGPLSHKSRSIRSTQAAVAKVGAFGC